MEVISDEPDNPLSMIMSNPSVTSAVFTAGIVVQPGLEPISVYKNGSVVNMTLTITMPFICPPHIHPQDCHLTIQVVQPDNGQVVISQCQLSVEPSSRQQSHSFLIVPVSDFVQTDALKNDSVVQLVVSSYGDAWWHGYQLPNISIKVYLF